jgi:hypothetical protein
MISYDPQCLVDEVLDQYGIEVPLELCVAYLESDPYLTPETLYMYMMDLEGEDG